MASWCVFVFKQKTAYEMRNGDWSSDVCSSDLGVYPASVSERIVCACRKAISAASLRSSRRNATSRASYHRRDAAGGGTRAWSAADACRHRGRIVPSANRRRAALKLPAFSAEPWSPSEKPTQDGGTPAADAMQIGRAHV